MLLIMIDTEVTKKSVRLEIQNIFQFRWTISHRDLVSTSCFKMKRFSRVLRLTQILNAL